MACVTFIPFYQTLWTMALALSSLTLQKARFSHLQLVKTSFGVVKCLHSACCGMVAAGSFILGPFATDRIVDDHDALMSCGRDEDRTCRKEEKRNLFCCLTYYFAPTCPQLQALWE